MLVLSRKIGERILIGEDISITVVRTSQGGVRLGIVAPDSLPVMREELRLPQDESGGQPRDLPDGAIKLRR